MKIKIVTQEERKTVEMIQKILFENQDSVKSQVRKIKVS